MPVDKNLSFRPYTYHSEEPQIIYLTCKSCGRNNIPWRTGILGCPPEYCVECRRKFDKRQDFFSKYVRDKFKEGGNK